jgi:hypothetical protein
MMDFATEIALEISRSQREALVAARGRKAKLQLGEAWNEGRHIDRRIADRAAAPCRRADDFIPMEIAA